MLSCQLQWSKIVSWNISFSAYREIPWQKPEKNQQSYDLTIWFQLLVTRCKLSSLCIFFVCNWFDRLSFLSHLNELRRSTRFMILLFNLLQVTRRFILIKHKKSLLIVLSTTIVKILNENPLVRFYLFGSCCPLSPGTCSLSLSNTWRLGSFIALLSVKSLNRKLNSEPEIMIIYSWISVLISQLT